MKFFVRSSTCGSAPDHVPNSKLIPVFRRKHSIGSFALGALILALGDLPAGAQSVTAPPVVAGEAFRAGDIAATGFAGVGLQSESLKPGVDPVSKTVLNPDGTTLRIYDAATLGGAAGGQIIVPQTKLELKARDIGHVFALAFDAGSADGTSLPSLYAAATSAFGLNIVGPDKDGDGKPDRLSKGAPGAVFMQGQFGGQKGAGPGTIWKIDQATGAPSVFANIETNGVANSGAGIGGLAIDVASKTLYVSDLDTGLIHRLALQKAGADQGVFDHGLVGRPARGKAVVRDDRAPLDITSPGFDPAKPDTWKYTAPERRVHGLAVHEGRLYYAVAEGSEIWSVGLEADGAFKIDPRFEAGIGGNPGFPFTGIVFDRDGRMILAQRGSVQNPADYSQFASPGDSKVLRLTPQAGDDASRWKLDIEEYAIGNAEGHRASSGGLATHYGYKPDGSIDLATCDGTLAVSADALGEKRAVHGLQLTDINLVRPANVPPSQSVSINWDARLDDAQARGYAGGVASFQNCQGGAGFPAVADGGAEPPPVAGGEGFPPLDGGTTAPPVEPTPPPIEGGGGGKTETPLQVTKTAGVATCSPKGGCAFNITVTNPTATEVAGPIVIDEQIDAAQATLTGKPNAPWTCTDATPFTCTHPGPIAANAKIDMRVVFAPNTPAEIKTVKNCAAIQGAAAALPEACATVTLDPNAPVQTGPIIVSKKATSACTSIGPCSFTITVTNSGDAALSDFVIEEQIDAPNAVLVGEASAPWTCTKEAPFSCTHKGALDAKATVDLELSFSPKTPPEKKTLKNCAIPKQPAQAAPAKQLAPEKKSEAPSPFGGNSLVQHASFRVPGFGKGQSLIQRVGGIGGTGVNCAKRKPNPIVGIRQANGANIRLDFLKAEPSGLIEGTARLSPGAAGKSGTFTGAFHGVILHLTITWRDGTKSSFRGTFDAAGNLSGTTRNHTTNEILNFGGLQPWPCAETNACSDYANKAMAQVSEFKALGCGPLPLQMSANREDHVNFCMGPHDTDIDGEHVTRDQQIAACKTQLAEAKAPPPPPPVQPPPPVEPPVPAAEPAPEQCATVPIGPPVVADGPPPPVVPLTLSKLVLAKNPVASQCSDAGGGCDFVISITNTGAEEFNGPIEFTDDATAGDGKPFLNLTMLGGQAIGEPGVSAAMSCVRAGAGFKCGTAPNFPAKIAAGKTVRIPMSFKPGGGTGATSIKNCAQLTGSADKSCVNIPLVTGQLLRVLKQGGGSTCVPDCTFSISVQNVGTEEARGMFAFDDVFTPGGEAASFTVIDGDFKCAKVDAKARCASNRPFLKPGESTSVRLKVSGVAKAPQYQNCAELAESSGFAILKDFPGRCVTINDTTPPPVPPPPPPPQALDPRPNIAVTSMKPFAPTCAVKGPSAVKGNCQFEAVIENKGEADFEGTLRFDVVTSKHVAFVMQGNCRSEITDVSGASAQIYNCEVRKNVKLSAKGGLVSVLVDVEPGDRWVKNNVLKACTSFSYQSESVIRDLGAIKGDDVACGEVTLDPFAVSVTKSGGQNCQAGGDCRFTIALSNPGPIDHNAPVTITDQLTGIASAQIVSISPDLPCPSQPTQIPFSCTSAGDVRLDLGGKQGEEFGPKVFDMVVKLPPDATAFTNCAAVTDPAGGVPTSGAKESCVSVEPKPKDVAVEPSKCSSGMVLSASGGCACPPDTSFNGRSCSGGGSNLVQPPPVIIVPPSVGCLGGMELTAGGSCACPSGKRFSGRACIEDPGSGGSYPSKSDADDDEPAPPPKKLPRDDVADPTCPSARPVGEYPNCCPRGTRFSQGACKPPKSKEPRPEVKECSGSRPVGEYPDCCPEGTRFRRGACRPNRPTEPPPIRQCSGSRPVGEYPNCCPNGTRFIAGACRRPDVPQPRPTPVPLPPVSKICPDGTKVFGKYTQCPSVKPRPTPPKTCPPPTIGTYPNCRVPQCPFGQQGSPPNCFCLPPTVKIGNNCVYVKPNNDGGFKGPK